jgi:hypothetical protein
LRSLLSVCISSLALCKRHQKAFANLHQQITQNAYVGYGNGRARQLKMDGLCIALFSTLFCMLIRIEGEQY